MFPAFENWRFNVFTSVFNPIAISDELHLIEFDVAANAFGIRLFEAVRLVNPSTVAIVHNVTGGAVFTEVPRTTAPSTGQFRVDYLAATFFGTSFIEFNSADDGKEMSVSYEGLGTNVKDRYQLLQATIIPTNLGVEGNVQITDVLTVEGDPLIGDDVGNRDFNDRRYAFIQEDFDFSDVNKWLLDAGVSFDETGGTNSKRSLTLIGDSTVKDATFAINGVANFFPAIENGTVSGYIRAKISGGFDDDIVVIAEYFDKDKASLGLKGARIINTYLSGTYQLFSFAVLESNFLNTSFYNLKFRVEAGATAGQADIDFWKIGNNIGLTDHLLAAMMGDTGRGSYGGTISLAFSGKGQIQMNAVPGDNDYLVSSGNVLTGQTVTLTIDIDGTEFLQRQITHIRIFDLEIVDDPSNHFDQLVFKVAARGGTYDLPLADAQKFGIIPIHSFNTTTRKSSIRFTARNSDPFTQEFKLSFMVNILFMS